MSVELTTSVASLARKARVLARTSGIDLASLDFLPIDRYWSDEDARSFPKARSGLIDGEILAWSGELLIAFRPENLRWAGGA